VIRKVELAIAGTAIAAAAAFTAFVLLWHFGWDDAFWTLLPPRLDFHRFDAFGLYAWAKLALIPLFALAGVAAAIASMLGRRGTARSILRATLLGVILLGTAIIYVPLWASTIWRVDRIRGVLEEPFLSSRLLVSLVLLTVFAHGALLVVSGMRRTPVLTRRVAHGSAVVTCAILLNLFWLIVFMPLTEEWWPSDWRNTARLGPMRLCRGATLWEIRRRGQTEPSVMPIGRIDDLWLYLTDTHSGRPVRAISFVGSFREGYYWITLPETHTLRVRADDPALKDCDGTWRRDPVVAAILGWLIPGMGHIYQGRTAKGLLFMICILSAFFYGLIISDGRAVYASWTDSDKRLPYFCQLGVGLPALPARSSPATGSPVPPLPWSTNPNSG